MQKNTSQVAGFEIRNLVPFPVHCLCSMFSIQDVISQHPAPAAMTVACCHASPHEDSNPLEPDAHINSCCISFLGHGVLSEQKKSS